jgi:cobyrinic acid a,c-diamide synthase
MKFAKGLLIAAPRSGSGKTTVTLGLQRALAKRGLTVRGVKCGPDYIDPAFHAAATGAPSCNLDSFAMSADLIRHLADGAATDADLVIAEGSMGLFDGVRAAAGRTGASADIAALCGWPVVLVIDVSGQAQSAAAIALGCRAFDPRLNLAGVILNKVASPRHRRLVEDGMQKIGVAVLGALPREASLILPERHLGLVQAGETEDLMARLDALAEAVTAAVNLDRLVAVAGSAMSEASTPISAPPLAPPGRRVAVARDAAFSFVYPHVEAGWRAEGTSIVPFSPLADEAPADDCDACWLPGGYPELHGPALAAAAHFRTGMARFAETRPVHGECGGYMVLGDAIEAADGIRYPMLGLLPVTTSFAKRRMSLGYRVVTTRADSVLGPTGLRLTGHEFHYATILAAAPDGALGDAVDAEGTALGPVGHVRGHVSGSFFHAIARL